MEIILYIVIETKLAKNDIKYTLIDFLNIKFPFNYKIILFFINKLEC